jgi:hypothetical protein
VSSFLGVFFFVFLFYQSFEIGTRIWLMFLVYLLLLLWANWGVFLKKICLTVLLGGNVFARVFSMCRTIKSRSKNCWSDEILVGQKIYTPRLQKFHNTPFGFYSITSTSEKFPCENNFNEENPSKVRSVNPFDL